MLVPIKEMAYLDDFNFLKIILSSADNFPGLYRFNSSWRSNLEDPSFMKLISYLEACHWTSKGKKWSTSEWFGIHEKVFNMSYGPKGRNETRKDQEIGALLRQKSIDWYQTPHSFSLAVIDVFDAVDSIKMGQTYYMMGSLIKFNCDHVLISYDDLNRSSYLKLSLYYEDVLKYIETVFSYASLEKLFFKSEIVGQLDLNAQNTVDLRYDSKQIERLLSQYSGNSVLFAAPNYSSPLPIRFAKLIGVSNVCK
jgi:hypothetical protein